jgi:glucose-1-phosphate adenylyltransferase
MKLKEIMRKNEVALILAGGRGKRMDILCHLRPKPALPFAGGFRVIDFSLSNCIHSEITYIAALVDYQRVQMAGYLREWHLANGGAINLVTLPPRIGSYAGTADAVYQNLDYLEKEDAETVLVLAGDHVYKMDYRKIIAFHNEVRADVTIGVIRVPIEETGRFGTLTVDAENRVNEFVEKSSNSSSNLASMGIYVFNKGFLVKRLREDAREPSSQHDFGYSILPRMVLQDRAFAYEFNGYWQDIGTMEAYYEANMELLVPRPRYSLNSDWPIFDEKNRLPICKANKEGNITNSMISPGCIVEGYVENSLLSDGVCVEEQAVVRNSIIMADTHIRYHSVIDHCILDENVNIGKFSYVGFGAGLLPGNWEITVLGKDVVVPDRTAIGRRCRIRPGLGPEAFSRPIPSGTNLMHS